MQARASARLPVCMLYLYESENMFRMAPSPPRNRLPKPILRFFTVVRGPVVPLGTRMTANLGFWLSYTSSRIFPIVHVPARGSERSGKHKRRSIVSRGGQKFTKIGIGHVGGTHGPH